MEGLLSIQERILDQARIQAEEILAQANRQCLELLETARQECLRIQEEMDHRTAGQVEAMLNRARSLAAMETRKQVLQKRQALIDQVLDTALEKACAMPDTEKLERYVRMIRQLDAVSGSITLSAADLGLADKLAETLGDGFLIRTEPGRFAGGLILQRGRIEDNLTFDLIIRNQRPQLSALAAAHLPQAAFVDREEQRNV